MAGGLPKESGTLSDLLKTGELTLADLQKIRKSGSLSDAEIASAFPKSIPNNLRTQLTDDLDSLTFSTHGPAASRAAAIDKSGNLILGRDEVFTNLDTGKNLLSDNPNKQISGIEKVAGDPATHFKIVDVDAYMNDVKALYSEKGIELHRDTEQLIRQYINNPPNTGFRLNHGPPGTHSEVQALNDLYHRAGGRDNVASADVGTFKVANGDDFEACANCNGIISQDSNVTIITDP